MISVQKINKSFKAGPQKGVAGARPKFGTGLFSSSAGKPSQSSRQDFEVKKGRVHILTDVSFDAPPGQIYGLLGPNGSGKTTTLRCIATLLKPDSGTITVDGKDVIRDAKAVRASIGLLTSDMKLAGNLSPRYLLTFFGELNHLDAASIERRIAELAEYLDMASFLDTSMERCSTGQKQKTSIAVSLIHDPQVIIFDEPTNGLDILAAKTVVDFLKDFRSSGKTVILSTHIMSEAETLCDRIGIMLRGRIVAEGSRLELMSRFGKESLESVFFHLAQAEGVLQNA